MTTITLEQVLACPALPSLPKVAMDVLELTRRPDVNLKEIAKVVENDQALSAKILRTINSSYYALDKPCTTISRAMVYLGVNTIKSLVLGFSLVDITSGETDGFDVEAYWRRCVYSSAAARRIAALHHRIDPEEAFTVALLQDVGMLAINAAAAEEYAEIFEEFEGDHRDVPALEHDAFGFSHAEVSAGLAQRWKLPDRVVGPLCQHHDVALEQLRECDPLVVVTALGHMLAIAMSETECREDVVLVRSLLTELFETANEETLDTLVAGTLEDAKALSSMLQVSVGKHSDMMAIMAEAEDQRLEHSLTMQREVDELKAQALTDGLTGAFNRKRFDQELSLRFDETRDRSATLGVVLVDADRFKAVNDTHGHQVGDEVLVELARRFAERVGEQGIVCRYGGEEFVAILPGADLQQTTRVAEAIRRDVAAEPVNVSAAGGSVQELSITISVGGATIEPATADVFPRADVLVAAADRALYAAKHAGRNCVRVFNPKPKAKAV